MGFEIALMIYNEQFTVKNGSRHSTAQAFIVPIKKRHNLTVITGAFVTKINFNATNTQAVGVAMTYRSKEQFVVCFHNLLHLIIFRSKQEKKLSCHAERSTHPNY